MQVKLRLQVLLFSGIRRLLSPQSMEAQQSSLSLTAKEPSLPRQRARIPDFLLRGGKL
jgi:hypothetical protein